MTGLIPIGNIAAASDTTTAASIGRPGSQSQAAVDARVTPIAAAIIASDATVKDAAVAAMSDAAVIAGLAWSKLSGSGTDLNAITTPGVYAFSSAAIATSAVNRPYDVRQPFSLEVQTLSAASNIRRQRITEWAAGSNPVVWERLSYAGTYAKWIRIENVEAWDRRDTSVVWWGDSLVAGAFGPNSRPAKLNELVVETVNNLGRNGDTTNEVLLRAGILTVYATPVGGTIPASGSVALNTYGTTYGLRESRSFPNVWFAGVPGTLRHDGAEAWTFTRLADGTAVTVATRTPINATTLPRAIDVHMFLMGENDIWWNATNAPPEGDVSDHIVAAYQRAVDALPVSTERRVLIGGIKTTRSTVAGDARDLLVRDVNARLKALFPAYYVDFQAWLATDALAAAGITPTTEDDTAMAAGLVPPSAFFDDLHINDAVVAAEAAALWLPTLAMRGWVTPV